MTEALTEDLPVPPPGQRGRLKIFLGAVAAVGKTYRMLAEAHRRVERNGEDVVVGIVETHGRPATADLLKGLEQVPLKRIEYRGGTFYEMDTDAVIARHPQWVLVDELAHTREHTRDPAREALAERRGDPRPRHQCHRHPQHPAPRESQ